MTFNEMLKKFKGLVDVVVNTKDDRFQSPDTVQSWLNLREALEVELVEIPAEKRTAAARMAAIELVSMVLYPEGGGAQMEGTIGDVDSVGNPDIDDQLDMEMPETAKHKVPVWVEE